MRVIRHCKHTPGSGFEVGSRYRSDLPDRGAKSRDLVDIATILQIAHPNNPFDTPYRLPFGSDSFLHTWLTNTRNSPLFLRIIHPWAILPPVIPNLSEIQNPPRNRSLRQGHRRHLGYRFIIPILRLFNSICELINHHSRAVKHSGEQTQVHSMTTDRFDQVFHSLFATLYEAGYWDKYPRGILSTFWKFRLTISRTSRSQIDPDFFLCKDLSTCCRLRYSDP